MGKRPTCHLCKRRIGVHDARAVVNGRWICAACIYEAERAERKRATGKGGK